MKDGSVTTFRSHAGKEIFPVEQVIEDARYRTSHRTDIYPDRFSDLGVRWLDGDNSHTQSGWYAKIGTTDMRLTNQAVRSASRMVRVKDTRYWDQFPDRNAFPMTMAHVLENPAMLGNRKNAKSLLVRHNGLEVTAILPATYKVMDAPELLTSMHDMIKDNMGKISGVSVVGDAAGDQLSYRFVIGENIMKSLRSELGQHMMFLLATSESDAIPTETALGLFRTVCTNSAIREKSRMTWSHRGPVGSFMDRTGETIRMGGYFQGQYAKVFGELLDTNLDMPARDLLHTLRSEGIISNAHFDACQVGVDGMTEDNRPIETQYDMFNLLTAGAQSLTNVQQRQNAEARSMQLFTEAGGVYGQLQQIAVKQARHRSMRRGAAN